MASLAFVAKPLGSRQITLINDKAVSKALQMANKLTAQEMQRDLKRLTSTWQHKPEFHQHTDTRSKDISVSVYTEDEVFGYLDRGTRVRYALMSPDFKPKTRVMSLKSYAGRGGVVFVSRKNPLPGIKARKFIATLEKKHRPLHFKRVQEALKQSGSK